MQVVPPHSRRSFVSVLVGVVLVGVVALTAGRMPTSTDGPSLAHLSDADLQRLGGLLQQMNVSYGATVDGADVARASHRVGIGLGKTVDAADIRRLAVAHRASSVLASVGGVALSTPSHDVRLIGFHEAARPEALALRPADGLDATTLPTRRRGTDRRSAVDVAVEPATPVFAPASGQVVEVAHYRLYGKYPDVRIRIAPADAPDLLVTMLHVTGPLVRPGQRVEAGAPLGERATAFPFVSQIDRHAGAGPHLHLEVRHRPAPTPAA